MPKFDLTKKSDVKKLEKHLRNQAYDIARNELSTRTYEIACTKCNLRFHAKKGLNICPYCGNEINVELDFNF